MKSISELHSDYIIVGSSTSGTIQRISLIDKNIDKVDHLDWVESINKIVCVDDLVFAIAETQNSFGIIKYNIVDDKLAYIDYYNNFPIILNAR